MATDIEEICPSVDVLKTIETEVPCPVQGCVKTFCNTASLRMHVVKTHNITENDEEKQLFTRTSRKKKSATKKHFYCPVDGCSRGKPSKKPFPRLGQLKQHYMTVHAEKKHTCTKCSRGFGLEAACRRHEDKCGQLYPCGCGCPFTTREALYMHLRRKQHSLPVRETSGNENSRQATCKVINPDQPKPASILSMNVRCPSNQNNPVPARRYCPILPKPLKISKTHTTVNTQSAPNLEVCRGSGTSSKRDAETQTCLSRPRPNYATRLNTSSTQTTFDCFNCIDSEILQGMNNISYSSVGTQVNKTNMNCQSVDVMDFGSQVIPDVCGHVTQSSSTGTQHDEHLYLDHSNLHEMGDGTSSFSLSSQTMITGTDLQITDPRYLSSSETQTQDFDHVSLEDNAAQTLISILDFDPSCSADCGTQTQRMFDEILSQTSDVELTESQTQTWLSSLMPTEVPNHEFNRSTLEDLVNIQTQTPLAMNEMAFDAGLTNTETQTIPESYYNAWSFEPSNTQTQMTQTVSGVNLFDQFNSDNTSLMDTYTQTFLGDIEEVCALSSVQTQT